MKLFLSVFLVLSFSQGFAQDAARGKTLYKNCIQCHAEDARGNPAEEAPMIAGQFDWYIISSIESFKAGIERKNPKMLPFIKNLSKADIADLAAYISTIK